MQPNSFVSGSCRVALLDDLQDIADCRADLQVWQQRCTEAQFVVQCSRMGSGRLVPTSKIVIYHLWICFLARNELAQQEPGRALFVWKLILSHPSLESCSCPSWFSGYVPQSYAALEGGELRTSTLLLAVPFAILPCLGPWLGDVVQFLLLQSEFCLFCRHNFTAFLLQFFEALSLLGLDTCCFVLPRRQSEFKSWPQKRSFVGLFCRSLCSKETCANSCSVLG